MSSSVSSSFEYVYSVALNLSAYSLCLFNPIPTAHLKKTLCLSSNNLIGSVPPLGLMTTLDTLDLGFNKLSGKIRAEQFEGDISMIMSVYLEMNEFSGTIPTLVGRMTSLNELYLYGNNFSGAYSRVNCVAVSMVFMKFSLSLLDKEHSHFVDFFKLSRPSTI